MLLPDLGCEWAHEFQWRRAMGVPTGAGCRYIINCQELWLKSIIMLGMLSQSPSLLARKACSVPERFFTDYLQLLALDLHLQLPAWNLSLSDDIKA